MKPLLPQSMRVLERDWLSANHILFFDDGHHATVVDTGYVKHADFTCALIERSLGGRSLKRIINTHLHSDHCGGNQALAARHPAEIFVPKGSYPIARDWVLEQLNFTVTGQRCERFHPAGFLQDGDRLVLGGLHWQVHAAPGHDPESILLFEPSHRIMISADALWEDGFGVTFPELSGESGFHEQSQVLDLIESLNPLVVIPGHGPVFTEVELALIRARSRLAWLREDPLRNARYALKVLVKFLMLDLERATAKQLMDYLGKAQVLVDTARMLSMPVPQALDWSLESLVKSQALRQEQEWFVIPGLASSAPSDA